MSLRNRLRNRFRDRVRNPLLSGILLGCAALVLATGATAFGQDSPDPGFSDSLRKAMRAQDALADAGQSDEALSAARAAASSATADAYYLLGRALGNAAVEARVAGDNEEYERLLAEARTAFTRAKEIGSLLYAPAFLGLARCARFDGDLVAAERQLRQALRIEPAFKAAALELAQVLWERELPADSELEIHRLLEKRPDDTDARMLLGSLKMARRRWGEAEREFRAVLKQRPDLSAARRLLATVLMFEKEYEEAGEHFERLRAEDPSDPEPYEALFLVYQRMKDRERVRAILESMIENLPGTETAERARVSLEQLDSDPTYLDADPNSREALVARLQKGTEEEKLEALRGMRRHAWPALPAAVYENLSPKIAGHEVRTAAVTLIGDHGDPATLALLEILLFHPVENDSNARVRRAAVEAVAALPTAGSVALLYRVLDSADPALREEAVRGIAARTGKWFRADLQTETPAEDWPAEREAYARWWRSGSGSISKRKSLEALQDLFEHLTQGRERLAVYALDGLDDGNPITWRVGYALFRALTGQSFGAESGSPSAEDRAAVARAARAWLIENGHLPGPGGDAPGEPAPGDDG